VLSGRGLCDELITRPEESYRLWCVVGCDLETSRIGAPYIYDISSLRVKICYDFTDPQAPRKSESVKVTTFGRKAHKVKSPSPLNFTQSVANRIKSPRDSEGWDTT